MTTTVLTTFIEEGIVQADWTGLANAETGLATQLAKWPTKAAHATGTFGVGGAVAIEGSNNGTDFFALRDSMGVAISLTAAAPIKDVLENPRHIRARVTAGDGTTNIRVLIVAT